MPEVQNPGNPRVLAQSLEDIRPLHQLCREGRLYGVERWIAEGKPLQIAPQAIAKGTRPKTALQIALETEKEGRESFRPDQGAGYGSMS